MKTLKWEEALLYAATLYPGEYMLAYTGQAVSDREHYRMFRRKSGRLMAQKVVFAGWNYWKPTCPSGKPFAVNGPKIPRAEIPAKIDALLTIRVWMNRKDRARIARIAGDVCPTFDGSIPERKVETCHDPGVGQRPRGWCT